MGTSTEFFALDPKGNKKETITSKELSVARAESVKAYLIQQGIDASRISTKGEGGRVPLYPESGTLGQYNDRVEVEFVKN
jgi:outer membrane protein OmpA-like peptidoglycan-associated protein